MEPLGGKCIAIQRKYSSGTKARLDGSFWDALTPFGAEYVNKLLFGEMLKVILPLESYEFLVPRVLQRSETALIQRLQAVRGMRWQLQERHLVLLCHADHIKAQVSLVTIKDQKNWTLHDID
jgi:hypothetical protein